MRPNFHNSKPNFFFPDMVDNRDIVPTNPQLTWSWSWSRNLNKLGDNQQQTSPLPPRKPNLVTLPGSEVPPPPPLTAECKRPGKFSHPAIRWPLYALGGFLIARWALKKWKSGEDEGKN
ncbi:hypothetical protein SDJN03_06436, partial [Cucurbita argyrosperma subsp. sororia]